MGSMIARVVEWTRSLRARPRRSDPVDVDVDVRPACHVYLGSAEEEVWLDGLRPDSDDVDRCWLYVCAALGSWFDDCVVRMGVGGMSVTVRDDRMPSEVCRRRLSWLMGRTAPPAGWEDWRPISRQAVGYVLSHPLPERWPCPPFPDSSRPTIWKDAPVLPYIGVFMGRSTPEEYLFADPWWDRLGRVRLARQRPIVMLVDFDGVVTVGRLRPSGRDFALDRDIRSGWSYRTLLRRSLDDTFPMAVNPLVVRLDRLDGTGRTAITMAHRPSGVSFSRLNP